MATPQPLLQAPPDLEAGMPSRESQGAAVPEEQPQRPPVYKDMCCFLPMSSIFHCIRRNMLPSTPGYAWSVFDRRRVRALTVLAVFVASLLAEGMSDGFSYYLVYNNLIFGALLLFAGVVPSVICKSPIPDVVLGVAASEHTWRAAWRVIGTADEGTPDWVRRDALCSEHLAMFWVIVLPILCGGEAFALGAYGIVLLILRQMTGVPGAPCFLVAFCMLVPVYVAERVWCSAYDELHRSRMAVKNLLRGTGGAWCSVDVESGHIVEMSPQMEAFVGPIKENSALTELVRLPKDKETLQQLVIGSSIAAAGEAAATSSYTGIRWSDYTALMEEHAETALAPRDVSSLRCTRCPKGVKAQIIPYNLSLHDRRLAVWVEAGSLQPTDPRVELATREQAVAVREHESKLKLESLETRERRVEELEKALEELHGLYMQGLAEQTYIKKVVAEAEAEEELLAVES